MSEREAQSIGNGPGLPGGFLFSGPGIVLDGHLVAPGRSSAGGIVAGEDPGAWHALQTRVGELVALTLQASDPYAASEYAVEHLEKRLDHAFELLLGPRR